MTTPVHARGFQPSGYSIMCLGVSALGGVVLGTLIARDMWLPTVLAAILTIAGILTCVYLDHRIRRPKN